MLLADRGFDADWIGACQPARRMGQHPAETEPDEPIRVSPHLYRARNLVERFFNRIKQCRRVATRSGTELARRLAKFVFLIRLCEPTMSKFSKRY